MSQDLRSISQPTQTTGQRSTQCEVPHSSRYLSGPPDIFAISAQTNDVVQSVPGVLAPSERPPQTSTFNTTHPMLSGALPDVPPPPLEHQPQGHRDQPQFPLPPMRTSIDHQLPSAAPTINHLRLPLPPVSKPVHPTISKLAKANEETWLLIGSVAESMGDRDRALSAYENALRHNPVSISGLTQVAGIERARENYVKAVAYFQRAIQLDQTNGDIWGAIGHCHLMQGDLQNAYAAYQQVLYLLPNPKEDAKLWYGIGILYDRYGSLDHAEEAFASVLQMDKDFDKANEILFRLGIIYKQQGKYQESLECFDRILRNPPNPLARADIWFQIGHVYEQQKDHIHAKEAYERVLQENPHHAKVLQQLGWLHHQDGSSSQNQDFAITYLTKSLEADSSDAQSWYLLGRAYMSSQKYNKAYETYQQAVYRDGRNSTFWCSIGVLYFQINQYRDALDAYSRAIRINPYISEVWFDLGSLYESCNNQISDAIDAYGRAAELDPTNTQIVHRLQLLRQSQLTGASIPAAPGPQDVHPTRYANVANTPSASLAAAAAAASGAPHPQSQGPLPGAPPLLMHGAGGTRGSIFSRPEGSGGPGLREHGGPPENGLSLPSAPHGHGHPNAPPPFRGGPPPPVVIDDNHGPRPGLAPLASMDIDRPNTTLASAGPPPPPPLAREQCASRGPVGSLLLHPPPPGPPAVNPEHQQHQHSGDPAYYRSGGGPPCGPPLSRRGEPIPPPAPQQQQQHHMHQGMAPGNLCSPSISLPPPPHGHVGPPPPLHRSGPSEGRHGGGGGGGGRLHYGTPNGGEMRGPPYTHHGHAQSHSHSLSLSMTRGGVAPTPTSPLSAHSFEQQGPPYAPQPGPMGRRDTDGRGSESSPNGHVGLPPPGSQTHDQSSRMRRLHNNHNSSERSPVTASGPGGGRYGGESSLREGPSPSPHLGHAPWYTSRHGSPPTPPMLQGHHASLSILPPPSSASRRYDPLAEAMSQRGPVSPPHPQLRGDYDARDRQRAEQDHRERERELENDARERERERFQSEANRNLAVSPNMFWTNSTDERGVPPPPPPPPGAEFTSPNTFTGTSTPANDAADAGRRGRKRKEGEVSVDTPMSMGQPGSSLLSSMASVHGQFELSGPGQREYGERKHRIGADATLGSSSGRRDSIRSWAPSVQPQGPLSQVGQFNVAAPQRAGSASVSSGGNRRSGMPSPATAATVGGVPRKEVCEDYDEGVGGAVGAAGLLMSLAQRHSTPKKDARIANGMPKGEEGSAVPTSLVHGGLLRNPPKFFEVTKAEQKMSGLWELENVGQRSKRRKMDDMSNIQGP